MSRSSASPIGSKPPIDITSMPPQHGRWRRRVSLLSALAMGTSMAVVGVASTGAQALEVNFAQHRTATGSTSCNGNETPAKAVDASVATTSNKWCSTASSKWLEVDMGANSNGERLIGKFVVKHAGAGGESTNYNTKDFVLKHRVSTSDSWTTVQTVTGNTANVTTIQLDTFMNTRYLRLEVTAGTQPGSDGAARIYELEAWEPINLSIGSTAWSNGDGTDCSGTQTPAKAIDGVPSTKWCNTETYGATVLYIDFGSLKTVQGFRIRHAESGGETSSYNTRDYNLVFYGTTLLNSRGNFDETGINVPITTIPFAQTSIQKVGLALWDPEQGSGTGGEDRIYELEIYGY